MLQMALSTTTILARLMPFGAPSTPSAKGRIYPFAEPSGKARFLRTAVDAIALPFGNNDSTCA